MDHLEFDHFILTRFNVALPGLRRRPSDSWLTERWRLFSTFCAPSVAAQTCRNFTWIVFLHSDTPEWLRTELESRWGALVTPIYLAEEFNADSAQRVVEGLRRHSMVLTTRLDNDDAISKDFVQSVQAIAAMRPADFINFVDGAQLVGHRAFRRPYAYNPFISALEEVTTGRPARTVFVRQHDQLHTQGTVVNVSSKRPMWLQIVHGQNIANEVVGFRMRRDNLTPGFEAVLAPHSESNFDIAFGRVTSGGRVVLRLLRKPRRILRLWPAIRTSLLGKGQ